MSSWGEAVWTVNTLLQKLGQAPDVMKSFTAFPIDKTVIGLTFEEPDNSYDYSGNLVCSVGGVMIRMSDDKFPEKVSDGTLVFDNKDLGAFKDVALLVEGLEHEKTYYFTAFPYSTQGVYNVSKTDVNRAQCTALGGEVANVSIDIDNTVDFDNVVITCVDETDGECTQTATLTKTTRIASFEVPIGHNYHIEYGEASHYITPSKTSSKESIAGAKTNYEVTYVYFSSTISTTYTAGATCTCECDGEKYTAEDTSGSYKFTVHKVGTWTVTAKNTYVTSSKTVSIVNTGQSESVSLPLIETVNIAIDISNTVDFDNVVVKCVDETNSSASQSATLTKTTRTATFTVPIGHTYHVEYGEAENYITPTKTTSKVAIAGANTSYSATYTYFSSTINVTYTAGATCTCECGDTKYTATTATGSYAFTVHKAGTWVITVTDNYVTSTESVAVTTTGQTKNVSVYLNETVNVTININDTTEFNSVVVTCVDETDSICTKSATLTKTTKTTSFNVPKGHTYHVEYGEASHYVTPSKTSSKVATAGITSSYSATYTYFVSTIKVTYPSGLACTCTCGSETYTATTATGSYTFTVHKAGTWKITISSAKNSASTNVAITATGQTQSVSLSLFMANITVSYPSGATCTCVCGSKKYTASDTSGSYTFEVNSTGTWTITATNGTNTASKDVSITTDGQEESVSLSFVKIYGISRDITASSPEWARTDDAVGFTATASVGTVAGSSDFDNCYPWSEIKRETFDTGDVMVRIPKFWYQRYRDGDIEYIKIADKPCNGFKLHPAFKPGDIEISDLYISAYLIRNNISQSGVLADEHIGCDNYISNALTKGDGWRICNIAVLSAIQMLILVEFATYDVQTAIGLGYTNGYPTTIVTGTCDNIPGLTGTYISSVEGQADVVWRGIERLWGGSSEWIEGAVLAYTDGYYICNNPSHYNTNFDLTNYTRLSYGLPEITISSSAYYITELGLDDSDLDYVMLPSKCDANSYNEYTTSAMIYDDKSGYLQMYAHCQSSAWSGLFSTHFEYTRSNSWKYGSSCRQIYTRV